MNPRKLPATPVKGKPLAHRAAAPTSLSTCVTRCQHGLSGSGGCRKLRDLAKDPVIASVDTEGLEVGVGCRHDNGHVERPIELEVPEAQETTGTCLPLIRIATKPADGDLVREMLACATERIMEFEREAIDPVDRS